MSTLKTNTLTGTTSAGSINVTGEGGSTTTNLQQGLAKAYGYAQQRTSTVELKDSFNISSWSDDATGRSTWNINSDMSNTTYTTVASSSYNASAGSGVVGSDEVWVTGAGVFKQDTFFGNGTFYDNDYVYATVHGDLA